MQKTSPGMLSVLKNTFYILSGQGVQFIFRFIYAIILARVLGPHEYGLIGYGTSLYIAVLPLSRFGIEHVLIRVIGYDKVRGKKLLQSALPLRRVTAYACTLIFVFSALYLDNDPELQIILGFFSVALLGRSFAQWNLAVFTAYEANRYSFRLQALFRPLEVVLGLLVLLVWKDPLPVVLVHAVVWWLETFLGTVVLRKHFGMPKGKWDGDDLKVILIEAVPMCIAMTLTSILRQGPLLSYKFFAGEGLAVGNLALAMQVFGILSQLPIAANSASYPVLSRAIAKGSGGEIFFVETMLRLIIFLGTLLSLFGMTVGANLVVLVFGDRYSDAGSVIGATLWMMIPWAAIHSLMRVQTAGRHLRSTLAILVAGVLVFGVAARQGIAEQGIFGAVVAAILGMCVIALGLFVAVSRQRKINVWLAVVRPMAALAVSCTVLHILREWNAWFVLSCSWAAFLVSWFGLRCITFSEIKALSNFWRQRKRA